MHFPTLAERDKARREKEAQEKKWRAAYKSQAQAVPFLKLGNIPPFTKFAVALILISYIGLWLAGAETRYEIFFTFGFVPAYFSGAAVMPSPAAYAGPVTHLFLHGTMMHIAFNCIMALAFGIMFERTFGAGRTALFWFGCGLAGAAFYFALRPEAVLPVIGASGSISGLFAAAIMMMAEGRARMGGPRRGPLPLLIFWIVFMVATGFLGGGNTAWQAHVGGFLCGAALFKFFERQKFFRP